MTLTKADLIRLVVDNVGLNKREMAEAFFEEISASLETGADVKLSGFGGFQLRTKPERPGRNPKTGEGAVIAARRVVTFHPSQKLKLAVSELASKAPETGEPVSGAAGTSRIGRRVVAESV